MYLSGDAPLPAEYGFLPLERAAPRRCRTTSRSACSLAVDCANARRIGPATRRSSSARSSSSTSTTTTTTRASATINLIVADASSTAEIVRDLLRELDVALTPEIAEALYVGARHRHGPLPVREHDAEGAPARGGAGRGRRRRARHLPQRLRDGAVREAEAARARARPRAALRGRAAGRLVPRAQRLRRGRRGGAVLGGDHRLPAPGRRRARWWR